MHPKQRLPQTIIALILALTLISCNESTGPSDVNEYLTNAVLIGSLTSAQIQSVYPDNPEFTNLANYSVSAWRIVYTTERPDGSEAEASGLVLIPSRVTPNLLSLHRGTTFEKNAAPSTFSTTSPGNNAAWNFLAPVIASYGYIVVMPDQLGFGASEGMDQPFLVTRSEGKVSLDMLRATRELLSNEGITPGSRLFITGYSQGGATAMSLLRQIQDEAASEFNIAAVSAGGAPLNLPENATTILSRDELGFAPYLALLVHSYFTYYFPDRDLDTVFREPYLNRIRNQNLLGGTFSSNEIMAQLTNTTTDLFAESFLEAFLGDGESELKQRLQENDLSGVEVRVPLRIYHGTDDEVIPVENARTAASALQQAAVGGQVTYIEIEDADHFNAAFVFGQQSLTWFALQ